MLFETMVRSVRRAKALVSVVLLGAAAVVAQPAAAAGSDFPLDTFPKQKMTDLAALQNGAKMFVNYCLNCHGLSAMRYNRLRDLGLSEDQIRSNLLFTADKVGETMKVVMPIKDAKEWFGAVPPDLSVIARARATQQYSGQDWLYTYLRAYYPDSSRATGWNNLVFPNVGMPHVLWELQGIQKPEFTKVQKHGHEVEEFSKFVQVSPGTMARDEFDNSVADLVAFLTYVAEPAQLQRKQLGVWVLFFLSFFFVIAWFLNRAYWKDIK